MSLKSEFFFVWGAGPKEALVEPPNTNGAGLLESVADLFGYFLANKLIIIKN